MTSTNPHTSKPAASWWRASADLPLDGERQLEPPVPALIAAAHAEADKRRAVPKPSRLDRPIITAEQRRENEAEARFSADLLQGDEKFFGAVMEWINEDRRAKAIAAEAAEPGAGIALVRQEMLNSPIKAATGNSCC